MKTMNAKDYVFSTTLDIEALNIRMVDRIDRIIETKNQSDKFNTGVGTTNPNLLNHEEFQQFATHVEEFARECSLERNLDHHNHSGRIKQKIWYDLYVRSQRINSMWGLRYQSGQELDEHDHWPCVWGFSYYIDTPKDASGLYFNDLDEEVPIDHGRLLMFGGNMLHRCRPSVFEGYRYCIAGTICAYPQTSASLFYD